MVKFSHIADCHLGGWREPELRELGILSLKKAVEISINENVDFMLISGDLFDNAMPSIDILKEIAEILRGLKDSGITVYIVAGSHDFSASGKTIIDVFEKAGLVNNVVKFDSEGRLKVFEDKSGVKIAGYLGKKGSLEIKDYNKLDFSHFNELDGYKIFMFHSGIDEFKPIEMEKVSCLGKSFLPAGFDYYAGGHIHYRLFQDNIAFPGPIFPNNFKELCELKHGSFNLVNDGKVKSVELKLRDVIYINADVDGKSQEDAEQIINKKLNDDFYGKIVCLRVSGVLSSGKPSDIKFKEIECYCFLKNASKLISKEFEQANLDFEISDAEEIEEKLIEEYKEQTELSADIIRKLMNALNLEKTEGEKNVDFEKKLLKGVLNVFEQD